MSGAQAKLQKSLDIIQRGFEEFLQNIPGKINDECMQTNSKNVDRYAECMYKKSKGVDKQMKAFDFKMIYMGIEFDQCIKSNPEEQCIEKSKKTVEQYIAEFQKSLK